MTVETRLPALGAFELLDAESLAPLRHWITALRDRHAPGLAKSTLHSVQLVCSELATNALEHATGPRAVRLTFAPGSVLAEVDDGSPDSVLTPGRSATCRYGGHGLAIVGSLARWGTTRTTNGKTTWAELTA